MIDGKVCPSFTFLLAIFKFDFFRPNNCIIETKRELILVYRLMRVTTWQFVRRLDAKFAALSLKESMQFRTKRKRCMAPISHQRGRCFDVNRNPSIHTNSVYSQWPIKSTSKWIARAHHLIIRYGGWLLLQLFGVFTNKRKQKVQTFTSAHLSRLPSNSSKEGRLWPECASFSQLHASSQLFSTYMWRCPIHAIKLKYHQLIIDSQPCNNRVITGSSTYPW